MCSCRGWAATSATARTVCQVRRAFPSWHRSISTEIYLCHACSYQEIVSATARTACQAAKPPTYPPAPRWPTLVSRTRINEFMITTDWVSPAFPFMLSWVLIMIYYIYGRPPSVRSASSRRAPCHRPHAAACQLGPAQAAPTPHHPLPHPAVGRSPVYLPYYRYHTPAERYPVSIKSGDNLSFPKKGARNGPRPPARGTGRVRWVVTSTLGAIVTQGSAVTPLCRPAGQPACAKGP
jgi:hypothetical protein